MTAVVLIGSGPDTDPWHALDRTGAAIANLLGGARIVTTEEPDLSGADVVVVNASGQFAPGDSTAVVDALLDHSARGGGILAMHSSSLAFADDARWVGLLGGRWVEGVSMHPQIGHALIQWLGMPGLPVTFGDFVVYDERYTALEVAPEAHPVAVHTEDGTVHTLAWARDAATGRGRVFYDGLGHGVESFDSVEHRALIRAVVAWLAPTDAGSGLVAR